MEFCWATPLPVESLLNRALKQPQYAGKEPGDRILLQAKGFRYLFLQHILDPSSNYVYQNSDIPMYMTVSLGKFTGQHYYNTDRLKQQQLGLKQYVNKAPIK